jgi:hypothetical protein
MPHDAIARVKGVMMTRLLPLSLIALLAACGADGPPVKPSAAPSDVTPGVTMSGTANIGVIGGN